MPRSNVLYMVSLRVKRLSLSYMPVQEDPSQDTQLTIRIPNPKVYMARQSQWVGKRGKPRCDHCRTNNLKCDRITPVCNQCSWSTGNRICQYTPLPTPAHRGIPRCDRCRASKLKCDRNLPICNSCKEASPGAACNYTPKKKKPLKVDQASNISQKILPKTQSSIQIKQETPNSHMFYGHNIATVQSQSVSPSLSENGTSDEESNRTTNIFNAPKIIHFVPPSAGSGRDGSIIPQLDFKPISNQDSSPGYYMHIEPWGHPSLIPLPAFVRQSLRQLDANSFPTRLQFERKLTAFLDRMIDPLKEVASFSVEKYISIADCLFKNNTRPLSKRLSSWITIHKLCLGSAKYKLIMIPHDSAFSMNPALSKRLREQQAADLFLQSAVPEDFQGHHYDILPAREQLYDILTYAHRSHSPATQMMGTILHLRYAFVTWPMAELYVSLCPVCNPEGVDSD